MTLKTTCLHREGLAIPRTTGHISLRFAIPEFFPCRPETPQSKNIPRGASRSSGATHSENPRQAPSDYLLTKQRASGQQLPLTWRLERLASNENISKYYGNENISKYYDNENIGESKY